MRRSDLRDMKNYLFIILVYVLLGLGLQASNVAEADNLAPEEVAGARTTSVMTVKLLLDKGYPLIDVRGIVDFNHGHIPGAYHLSVKSEHFTAENLREIVAKDKAVIFYCNGIHCMGSSIAAGKAVEWGWTNVFYYREGFKRWKDEGFSFDQDEIVDLSHEPAR